MNLASQRHSLLDELASRGIRVTAQRRAVLEVIQEAEEHLDADSLLERSRVREPGLNRATVYRTIALLKKLRLIDELDLMHLEGEKHYYEIKPARDHIHMACFQCGRIEEFASPLFEHLKAEIAKQTGFSVRVVRLEVGGACRTCVATTIESLRNQEDAETPLR